MASEMIMIILTGVLLVASIYVLFAGDFFMTGSAESPGERSVSILDSVVGDMRMAARKEKDEFGGASVTEFISLPYGATILYVPNPGNPETSFIQTGYISGKCEDHCLCIGALDGTTDQIMYLYKCVNIWHKAGIETLSISPVGGAWQNAYPPESCSQNGNWAIPQCVVPPSAIYALQNVTGNVKYTPDKTITLEYQFHYISGTPS